MGDAGGGWYADGMEHINDVQLRHLRSLLEAEKTRLEAQITQIDDRSGESLAEDVGDEQDLPAQEADRERDARLADRHRSRIVEVDAALDRIRDGTYGICDETGEDIPYRRLELEPTTRYTVEALEQLEGSEQSERPENESLY